MTMVQEFADLYDRHTYKHGNNAAALSRLDTPRALARSVDYTHNPMYPQNSGVDGSGYLTYYYPTAPTVSSIDANPPTFIDSWQVQRLPENLRNSMIAANYLAARAESNTGMWKLGTAGVSQLRVQGILP